MKFKLQVKTSKPLKRDEIEEVSELLQQDIQTYGPLEVNGQEVALKDKPEVYPSERMSALGRCMCVTVKTQSLSPSSPSV